MKNLEKDKIVVTKFKEGVQEFFGVVGDDYIAY